MTVRIQFFFILFSVLLLAGILELTRRKKIRIKYSLFWIFVSVIFLTFSLYRKFLFKLADIMGVYGAENALFIIAILCILLLLVTVSVIVSRIFFENKKLTLKLGLLDWKVKQLEKKIKE
ncbi:MAG: DUF2304 domain-containing protein [Deltaproteobacteria bacterium]|nr:DUF2304 domain-containing protein [Deltaproteobacteria bacterium]